MERVFLGLGSNIGDRAANIGRARRLLEEVAGVRVVGMSSLIETRPVGYEDQPDFINAALEIETTLEPRGLLTQIKRIEREIGRKETFRLGPRVIDIDILLFGDRLVDDPGLTIPHPRMHERRFVLGPLAEIAPEVVHPVLKTRIIDLLDQLDSG
jgi:2-amino-4-hydroxy-6-hydroxymethyldihydropteridine diphosphokinase